VFGTAAAFGPSHEYVAFLFGVFDSVTISTAESTTCLHHHHHDTRQNIFFFFFFHQQFGPPTNITPSLLDRYHHILAWLGHFIPTTGMNTTTVAGMVAEVVAAAVGSLPHYPQVKHCHQM
jgi:hypothetical protein